MKRSKLKENVYNKIKKLHENVEQDNLGSSRGTLYGSKVVRIVIDGPDVKDNVDNILKVIKKHDPKHKIQYFNLTQKMVGNLSPAKLEALKRELTSKYDVTIEEKPLSKSLKKV